MPAKNQIFLDLLNDVQLEKQNAGDRDRALDALLAVDPANASAFRKAILDHKVFWNTVQKDSIVAHAVALQGPVPVNVVVGANAIAQAEAAYNALEATANTDRNTATLAEATAVSARAALAANPGGAGLAQAATQATAHAAATKMRYLLSEAARLAGVVCTTPAAAAAATSAATAAQVAVVSEQAIQAAAGNPFVADADADNDAFLHPAGNAGVGPFPSLRQDVAKRRVQLGVQNAPEDVLIHILSNNDDECRRYIASKKLGGNLESAHGWIKTDPPQPNARASNVNVNVLTPVNLQELKEQASELLLLQLIAKCKNPALLLNLHGANGSAVNIITHLAPLRSSATAAVNFSFPNHDANMSPNLLQKITERREFLLQSKAKKDFDAFLEGLTDEVLLTSLPPNFVPKTFLEANNNQPDLTGKFPDILTGDAATKLSQFNQAKGILGERYLRAYIANKPDITVAVLFGILNPKATQADMITKLKAVRPGIGDYEYVEHAVTHDFDGLKTAMIQKIIGAHNASPQEIKDLDDLSAAEDLNAFKGILKNKFNIQDVDWIRDHHYEAMKQSLNSAQFKLKVNGISQLGAEAHPQLLKAFSTLSSEKQKQILDEGNVRHLLHAKDKEAIAHYFGSEAVEHLEKGPPNNRLLLVTENEKNALFNGIHNAAVAKILANMYVNIKPEVFLLPDQVRQVNALIARENNLSDPAAYQRFVTAIADPRVCPQPAGIDFNLRFGIAPADATIRDRIRAQQLNNEHVVAQKSLGANDAYKKFYDFLLKLDKNHPLTDVQINALKKSMKNADSMDDFIEKAFDDPTGFPQLQDQAQAQVQAAQKQNLKALFTSQLTPATFNDIKTEIRKSELLDINMRYVKPTLDKMTAEFEKIRELNQLLLKQQDKLKPLLEPDYRPSLGKEEYQKMSAGCDDVLDQLKRNYALLDSQLKSLPPINVTNQNTEIQKKIHELRNKVRDEKELIIPPQFKFYQKVQYKISKNIIPTIVENDSEQLSFAYGVKAGTPPGQSQSNVSWADYADGDVIPPLPGAGGDSLNAAQTQMHVRGVGGRLSHLELGSRGVLGATRVFDVGYKIPGAQGQPGYDTYSRFNEKRGYIDDPSIVASRNGGAPGVYTIDQFPQEIPGVLEGNALIKARVNFAMIMTTQGLANLKKAPTAENPITLEGSNKEELEYLWTALVVLGQNNPKMKFDMTAIKVHSTTAQGQVFDPASQAKKTTLDKLRGTVTFNSDSLYQTKFRHHIGAPETDPRISSLNQATKDKEPTPKKTEEQVRQQFENIKSKTTEARATSKKQGVAPVPEKVLGNAPLPDLNLNDPDVSGLVKKTT